MQPHTNMHKACKHVNALIAMQRGYTWETFLQLRADIYSIHMNLAPLKGVWYLPNKPYSAVS